MAGSYKHLAGEGGGWSHLENMGDAYEAVEELLFLVLAHLDETEIDQALEEFYRFSRGEKDPEELSPDSAESESMPSQSDYGKAYLRTQEIMER